MQYLIPTGIGLSYIVFGFAMREPIKGAGKKLGNKLRNKIGKRGAARSAQKPPANLDAPASSLVKD
jgi:hypothetical protein